MFLSYHKTSGKFGFSRTRDLKSLNKVLFAIRQGSEKKILVLSPYFYGLQNVESHNRGTCRKFPTPYDRFLEIGPLNENCYQLNNARLTTC